MNHVLVDSSLQLMSKSSQRSWLNDSRFNKTLGTIFRGFQVVQYVQKGKELVEDETCVDRLFTLIYEQVKSDIWHLVTIVFFSSGTRCSKRQRTHQK